MARTNYYVSEVISLLFLVQRTLSHPSLSGSLLFLWPGIEVGNGLPDLEKPSLLTDALKEAGFEIVDSVDLAKKADPETPWYLSLSGSFSLTGTSLLSLCCALLDF